MSKNQKTGNAHQQHTPQTGQEHSQVRQAQEHEHHAQSQLGQEQHRAHQVQPEMTHGQHHEHVSSEKKGVAIYINRKPYHVPTESFKASALRQLSTPPIGPELSLYRVTPGNHDDVKLNDTEIITINPHDANKGRHFYSDTVTPTHEAVASKAFSIYVENGCQNGHDAEDWNKAEAQLKIHSQKKE